MSKLMRLLYFGGLFLFLITTAFIDWALNTPQPMTEARQSLLSNNEVEVKVAEWLVFKPIQEKINAGLVFYPGGRVDPVSYAPAAEEIASAGYLVVITPMPLNLAFFSPQQASTVIKMFPLINHWVIAGHSLGGVIAAQYAARNSDRIQGLILWAAYPASDNALSMLDFPVLSLAGSKDGLVTLNEIQNGRLYLPSNTKLVVIEGGNHAQFGWYGDQVGDRAATITRSEQQEVVIRETIAFLDQVVDQIP